MTKPLRIAYSIARLLHEVISGGAMNRRGSLLLGVTVLSLAIFSACGGGSGQPGQTVQGEAQEAPPEVEIEIFEWRIGAEGGQGDPGAFITQARWEPARLIVPLGRPFRVRFVPRDERFHSIKFGRRLIEEVGMDLPVQEMRDGQSVLTPVLIMKTANVGFDVRCQEHGTLAGTGVIIATE